MEIFFPNNFADLEQMNNTLRSFVEDAFYWPVLMDKQLYSQLFVRKSYTNFNDKLLSLSDSS